MSDDLGFPHDHSAIAWNHFLAQHIGKLKTEGFVKSFYQPIDVLDKALNDLYTKRWLETAEGEQLDGIGSIVGLSRTVANYSSIPYFGFISQIAGRAFGVARLRHTGEPYLVSKALDDTEYRTFIELKIALNNGHGTAEELMTAFNTELGITKTKVYDVGNANARVYFDDFNLINDIRSTLLDTMIPKAAGVKLWMYYADDDTIFGFVNQNMGYFGFGIGILAQSFKSIVIKQQLPEPSRDPNLILNFMSPGALDPRVVFTRGSSATYYDSNAIVKTVTGNSPRWGYNLNTRRLNGLMIEEQRTNIIPNYSWGAISSVITGFAGLAPDGTNDAYRIAETADLNFHWAQYTSSVTPSTSHFFSAYAKAQEVRYLQLTFDGTGGGTYATFDVQTGTITENPNGTARIQAVGNGFYRCSVGAAFGTGTDARIMLMLSDRAVPGIFPHYMGDPAKGLLCWGAQFEDGSAISSYIPTTTVAVTRAAEKCYIPTEGWFNNVYSLQTEYIPSMDFAYCGIADPVSGENSAFYSGGFNKFSSGNDGIIATGLTPITFNQVNKQCGTYDPAINGAWKCANNGGGVGHSSGNKTPQVSATKMSIGSDPWNLIPFNVFMREIKAWPFVLSDEEMQTVTAKDLSPSLDLDFMSPGKLDSRITFTRNSLATYTDSAGVIKSVPLNGPRWDYDPITHQLKGTLIEEQRTNIIHPSIPGVGWNTLGAPLTLNAGIAPDGTNSLVKMNNDTTNSFHGCQVAGPGLPNTKYICSVYVKKGEVRYFQMIFDDLGGGMTANMITFDLETYTVSVGVGSITHVGNGIYRCVLAASLTGPSATQLRLGINNCNIPDPSFYYPYYVGVPTDGTYVWGAQIEQSEFVTSYIPTTNAVVTRAVDLCSIAPANMTPWYDITVGSWLAEFIYLNPSPTNGRIISLRNSENVTPIYLTPPAVFAAQYDTASAIVATNAIAMGTIHKAISTWIQGRAKICSDGGSVFASTYLTHGYLDLLITGISFMTPDPKCNTTGYLQHIAYWPRELSDADMIEKTKVTT